jgi:hypothetical protein
MGKWIGNAASSLKRASPAILTLLGALGVVVTSVVAAKATIKANKLLEVAKDQKGDNLTVLETMEIVGTAYIPTAAIGIATITCIFGVNVLNKRNQASLISAYAFLAESHRQYKKAVNAVFGADADSKIQVEVAKQMYISGGSFAGCSEIYAPDNGNDFESVMFYDCYSKRYFESTFPAVMNAQYHLNRNFVLGGTVSVNEFYELLGIDLIDHGDDFGWGNNLIENNTMWIDFDNRHTKMEGGMECYIVSTVYEPELLE